MIEYMNRDRINYIEDLLEKYFDAETTLEQERELREFYFSNRDNILPDSISAYRDIFIAAHDEISQIDLECKQPDKRKKGISLRIINISLISAIAASVALFLVLRVNNVTDDVSDIKLVSYGEVIEDDEVALDFVERQLRKIGVAFGNSDPEGISDVTINPDGNLIVDKISVSLKKMAINMLPLEVASDRMTSTNNKVESIINKIQK